MRVAAISAFYPIDMGPVFRLDLYLRHLELRHDVRLSISLDPLKWKAEMNKCDCGNHHGWWFVAKKESHPLIPYEPVECCCEVELIRLGYLYYPAECFESKLEAERYIETYSLA